jgi:hypothetical protein
MILWNFVSNWVLGAVAPVCCFNTVPNSGGIRSNADDQLSRETAIVMDSSRYSTSG